MKMMEDPISNDFTSMEDCDKLDATGDLKLDCKNYFNEDSSSPKSDLDSELEKCYKILDLESKVELESCLEPDECNIEDFVKEESSNFMNNISTTKTCRVSLGSKLGFSDALYHNINTRSSFLNMTGEQLFRLKNSLINHNKESNSNEEKSDQIETIIPSSDTKGLLESKSSSSLPNFQGFITDETSKNSDIEGMNKFSPLEHKNFNNKIDNLSKNFKNSLEEDVNQNSHSFFKLDKYDCKDYDMSQNKKIKFDTDFSDFDKFIQCGNLDAIFNTTNENKEAQMLSPNSIKSSNTKVSINQEPIDSKINNKHTATITSIKEFALDHTLSLNDGKNELLTENSNDNLNSKDRSKNSNAFFYKADLMQMSDSPNSQNLEFVKDDENKFCESNLPKKACLDIEINQINSILDSETKNAYAIKQEIGTAQTSNSHRTQNLKPSNEYEESAFCGESLSTATCLERKNNEIDIFLSDSDIEFFAVIEDESLDSNNNQNLFSNIAENEFAYENFHLAEPETEQNNSLKFLDNKSLASSSISSVDLDSKHENLLKDSCDQKSVAKNYPGHKNKNDSLSALICIKQEKCEKNNKKESKSFCEKLSKTQEKCEVNEEKENIVLSEKLSLTNNAISQKTDPKIKIQTPEKHQPSRIFKLAVANINNSKNNYNSACNNKSPPNIKNSNFESNPVNIISKQEALKTENLKNNEMKDSKGVPYKKTVNPVSDETSADSLDILKKDELKNGNVFKDYLEDEKDDLINPEWDAVKNLTTNEERYQQVRTCWGSRKIPNPNKNLTYHSYRKRIFGSGHQKPRIVTQHKRQASTNLNGKSAKRLCTFLLDNEINNIKGTMENEEQAIINEMHDKISFIDEQRHMGNPRNVRLLQHFDSQVSVITYEYNEIVKECKNKFEDKIFALNERRKEVLKFYEFYEGLNVSGEDPTQLTETQFQELEEIDSVYKQLDTYYIMTGNTNL